MVLLMAIPPDRNMHSDKGSPSTSEGRKSSKPIMEKRRRARINASLSELKSLLLEVIKKEGSRHSKMEKADILEMTVKHLRQLQRQQFTGSPKTDTNVLNNYRLGFEECAQEVTRYLSQMDICDVDLRSRILNHLASSVSSGIFNPSPPTTPVSAVSPTVSSQPCSSSPSMSIPSTPVLSLPSVFNPVLPEQPTNLESFTSMTSGSPCINQPVQMTKVMSGVQLIPTKLQSGEIAFVVPSNVISSGGQVPSYIIPVYPQPATEAQPQSTIAPSTISPPTIISQMPIFQGAQPPPLPILSKPPETATQNLFVSAPPKQPMLTLPTSNPFYSTPVFTPRPSQPPSSTVTSQRQVNPRPMLLPNLPPDSIGNHPIRPDLPRDDSMWRPW